MTVELGPEHEQLIEELYSMRERIQMSRSERLIIEMAIQMIECLDEYLDDIPATEYQELSLEAQSAALRRADARKRPSRILFTFEDLNELICSEGFDLCDGQLLPR
jgi:hypothetical protein